MNIKPNQLVAALTPVVFAPLAGIVSVFAAQHAGVDLDASSLQAVFIAGATIAFAKAGLWLKGWQAYEKRQAEAPDEPDLDDFLDEDLAADDDEPVPAGATG
jgi:hypothetical protein